MRVKFYAHFKSVLLFYFACCRRKFLTVDSKIKPLSAEGIDLGEKKRDSDFEGRNVRPCIAMQNLQMKMRKEYFRNVQVRLSHAPGTPLLCSFSSIGGAPLIV
jgi:hypothetical protein